MHPEITGSPGFMSLGIDSPVIATVLSELSPETTTPSREIFSPGFTNIISPGFTSSVLTSIVSPSLST